MNKSMLVSVILLTLLVGCMEEHELKLPADTKAKDLVPDVAGYSKYDATDTVTVVTAGVGETGRASPEAVTQAASAVARFAACMQAKGASKEVGYYDIHLNSNDKLVVNLAVVGIGDKETMTNPAKLASCAMTSASMVGPSLCREELKIKSSIDNNEFVIEIVGIAVYSEENSCKKVKEAILAKAKSLEK